ncbi:hypothetical protein D3C71_920240 [compost metagenome]
MAGLAREGDQHLARVAHRGGHGDRIEPRTLGAHGLRGAAAAEVHHPAADREQREPQAREHHHDAPRQAPVGAHVQRVDAVHEAARERLVGIAFVAQRLAGRGLQVQAVARALVLGMRAQVDGLHLRAVARGQPQRHLGPVAARGVDEGLPDARQVERHRGIGRRAFGARHAAFTDRAVDRLAQAVEGPVHAGGGRHHVGQQRDGADHRMQVPQEGTAAQREVDAQPLAPREGPARPAQVQARQREQQQQAGQRAGEGLAVVARQQQPAVQLLDELEEVLAHRIGQQRAGGGIGEARLAAPLTGRRREPDARGAPGLGRHGDGRDAPPGHLGLHARNERRRCQCGRGRGRRDRVQQVGDLGAERQRRPAQADDDQHAARRDADEPMDLEPDATQQSHEKQKKTRNRKPRQGGARGFRDRS